jgi:hypothetical protein
VQTHLHLQKVKSDKDAMNEFLHGYEPLVEGDVAEMAV